MRGVREYCKSYTVTYVLPEFPPLLAEPDQPDGEDDLRGELEPQLDCPGQQVALPGVERLAGGGAADPGGTERTERTVASLLLLPAAKTLASKTPPHHQHGAVLQDHLQGRDITSRYQAPPSSLQ